MFTADIPSVLEKLDKLIEIITLIEKKMSGNCLPATPLEEKILSAPSIPEEVTLVKIRSVLNTKREKAKELLQKYGVKRLSDLNPLDYLQFLEEAEVL
ncbi:MAG: hypothetical protein P4L59_16445 [Desulfosporosinus sp.]|nr:hypothetical protein [Desulfosporosinus sp.]